MRIQDIDTSLIDIPAGRRVVDPVWAEALAADIREHGQTDPIQIIETGDRFRLIYGAHRLAAIKLLTLPVVAAKVYAAGEYASEAAIKLAEISENFKRRELTVLDRAFDVFAWRAIYEAAAGTVKPGKKAISRKLATNSDGELEALAEQFSGSFSKAAIKAFGLSRDAIFRSLKIARITQDVREQISLIDLSDNQSQLLALSAETAERQVKIANLLTSSPPACGTVEDAIALIDRVPPAAKPERWEKVSDAFGKLPDTAKRRVLIEHWSLVEAIMAERQAA